MKITLYFGSFNPVHNGHIALAQYLLDRKLCDKVWFVPSPQNPLKAKSNLWNDYFRLHILKKAVTGMREVEICDIEFSLPRPNFTYATLRTLREKHPNITFSMLIGGDNYDIFDQWRNYQEILDNHTLFVYPRISKEIDVPLRYPSMIYLNDAPLLPISSTQIREALLRHDDISNFIPLNIIDDIIHYHDNNKDAVNYCCPGKIKKDKKV